MSSSKNGTEKGQKKLSKGGFKRERKEYNDNEHYFTEKHEDAIVEYCKSEDEEYRSELYREVIGPVFEEMIIKIMRTYSYDDSLPNPKQTVEECGSWIPTILDKYDPDAGSKAFSYFSVAIRNWFIQRVKECSKKKNREKEYEDIPKQLEMERLTDENTYLEDRERREFIQTFKEELEKWDKGRLGDLLGKNDEKVVKALQVLFENPEKLDVLHKRGLYLYMREMTGLNTKQISRSLSNLQERFERFKARYKKGDYDEGSASIRKMYL